MILSKQYRSDILIRHSRSDMLHKDSPSSPSLSKSCASKSSVADWQKHQAPWPLLPPSLTAAVKLCDLSAASLALMLLWGSIQYTDAANMQDWTERTCCGFLVSGCQIYDVWAGYLPHTRHCHCHHVCDKSFVKIKKLTPSLQLVRLHLPRTLL